MASPPIPADHNPKTISDRSGGGIGSSSILYIELARGLPPETGEIQGDVNSYAAKRVFLVSWDDRFRFVQTFIGWVRIVNNQTIVEPPLAYPSVPDMTAKRFAIRGYSGPMDEGVADTGGGTSHSYNYAEITIEYDNAPVNRRLDPTTLYAYTVDVTAEVLQTEGAGFRWRRVGGTPGADGSAIDFPLGQKVLLIDFTILQPNIVLQDFPFAYLSTYVGKMNSAVFQGLNPHYCVYLGPTAQGETLSGGVRTVDIVHRFQARGYPWTHAYRPGYDWLEVNPWPYQEADLNGVFSF